jgi:hypothetical protein
MIGLSLGVARAPYGTITTVQSEDYPKVVDIKKIFFTQQVLHQPVPVPASSAVTLQLPADIEKEVVAKDGINKLKLFHICGMIDPDSTTFGVIAYPTFTPGMEIVLSQPRASRAGALSDLTRQALKDARDSDIYSIRSRAVSLKHISKAMTTHILTGNFVTDEAASLDNKAHAIDPFVFLPQKNTTLVNREASKDLHARSENVMDVLDSHKSKTATSIARIGTMQDVEDFTSLCINSDTFMMGMFSTEGPQPLYRQFLSIFVKTNGQYRVLEGIAIRLHLPKLPTEPIHCGRGARRSAPLAQLRSQCRRLRPSCRGLGLGVLDVGRGGGEALC